MYDAGSYDEQAALTGWLGPEVVFGLMYDHIKPGETLLDIGIGTGLSSILFRKAGLKVLGMDCSEEMLSVCRRKGFAASLTLHDLADRPYPYTDASVDHVVCLGVLQLFEDPVFFLREAGRLLRRHGLIAFTVVDRGPGEDASLEVGPEHTGTGRSVTVHRHGPELVRGCLRDSGFSLLKDLEFAFYIDPERSARIRAKAYIAMRAQRKGADKQ
jgi:predicted TPR repeat methyltransferase